MLNVRKQNLLLDRDVAMLYRVEIKRLNETVKNRKFLEGFIIELDDKEFSVLRSKFNH